MIRFLGLSENLSFPDTCKDTVTVLEILKACTLKKAKQSTDKKENLKKTKKRMKLAV